MGQRAVRERGKGRERSQILEYSSTRERISRDHLPSPLASILHYLLPDGTGGVNWFRAWAQVRLRGTLRVLVLG